MILFYEPNWEDCKPAVHAIQAVHKGEATPEQQRLASLFILHELCGHHRVSFDPQSERVTSFNEGRRFVGQVLTKAANTPIGDLVNSQKVKNERRKPNRSD